VFKIEAVRRGHDEVSEDLGETKAPIAGIAAGIGGAVLIAALIVVSLWCRRTRKSEAEADVDLGVVAPNPDIPKGSGFEDGSAGEYSNPMAETIVGTEMMWEAAQEDD
jgi:hypothetical protein